MESGPNQKARIDEALAEAVGRATRPPCPAQLAGAIHYAVFPGGGRIRPAWCLTVAAACRDDDPDLATAAAVAVELLHCASLVQDDLPCFDDAAIRRGRETLHRRFGEPMAILVGDALIVMAFDAVAAHVQRAPAKAAAILQALARAAGVPAGIAAGQAWESEPNVDVPSYHHAKTAALFEVAAIAGAVAGGEEPQPWRTVGGFLGEAYQIADDLADALGESGQLGKPTHKDGDKARPSIVRSVGSEAARRTLGEAVDRTLAAIPPCLGRRHVEDFLRATVARLYPPDLVGSTRTATS